MNYKWLLLCAAVGLALIFANYFNSRLRDRARHRRERIREKHIELIESLRKPEEELPKKEEE